MRGLLVQRSSSLLRLLQISRLSRSQRNGQLMVTELIEWAGISHQTLGPGPILDTDDLQCHIYLEETKISRIALFLARSLALCNIRCASLKWP